MTKNVHPPIDCLQERVRLELGHEDERRAGLDGALHGHSEAVDVVQGYRAQHHVVGRQTCMNTQVYV